MRGATNFLAAVIGLSAGIGAGLVRKPAANPSTSSLSLSERSGLQPAAGPVGETRPSTNAPGFDTRFARVFSSFQHRIFLRQRLELYEALRDVKAEDMPGLIKHAESLRGVF